MSLSAQLSAIRAGERVFGEALELVVAARLYVQCQRTLILFRNFSY
jgi:hypothetical protein